jgi:hypothetical protein
MNKIKPIIIIILSVLIICGLNYCKDPDDPEENPNEIVYTSLTADKDSIDIGETITFLATATGDDIIYEWIASSGTLLGSGNQITFNPSPCIFGEILVTCTVKDKYEHSSSKDVSVYVRQLE